MRRAPVYSTVVLATLTLSMPISASQAPGAATSKTPVHARQVKRLLITGAMVR